METLRVGSHMAHAIASEVCGLESLVLEFWIQIPEQLGETLADILLATPLLQQGIHFISLDTFGRGLVIDQLAIVVQIFLCLDCELQSSLDGLIGL